MPCRFPLEASRPTGSDEKPLIYRTGTRPDPLAPGYEALDLPCGQCTSCRLEKSRVWGARICHEAQYLEEHFGRYSSFITLTYSEKHLPMYGSLVPEHLQKFFKRFRARIAPRKIRYYASGEYGSRCPLHELHDCPACGPIQRPHYHAIVLGFDFPDRKYIGHRDGLNVYESDFLSSLWTFGFHEIGSCSFESACYVARYVMKKVTGKKAPEHYTRMDPWTCEWHEIEPEFARMSRGGRHGRGIGFDYYQQYKHGIFDSDSIWIPGRGLAGKPPAYYDRLFGEEDPIAMEAIKEERRNKAAEAAEKGPSLISKAMVEDSKLALLKRKL